MIIEILRIAGVWLVFTIVAQALILLFPPWVLLPASIVTAATVIGLSLIYPYTGTEGE